MNILLDRNIDTNDTKTYSEIQFKFNKFLIYCITKKLMGCPLKKNFFFLYVCVK